MFLALTIIASNRLHLSQQQHVRQESDTVTLALQSGAPGPVTITRRLRTQHYSAEIKNASLPSGRGECGYKGKTYVENPARQCLRALSAVLS